MFLLPTARVSVRKGATGHGSLFFFFPNVFSRGRTGLDSDISGLRVSLFISLSAGMTEGLAHVLVLSLIILQVERHDLCCEVCVCMWLLCRFLVGCSAKKVRNKESIILEKKYKK